MIERLLSRMSYEMVYTPKNVQEVGITIRDIKDYPIIYTAIIEDVDVLVTGDKDFEKLGVERPEILTPSEFLDRYASA